MIVCVSEGDGWWLVGVTVSKMIEEKVIVRRKVIMAVVVYF